MHKQKYIILTFKIYFYVNFKIFPAEKQKILFALTYDYFTTIDEILPILEGMIADPKITESDNGGVLDLARHLIHYGVNVRTHTKFMTTVSTFLSVPSSTTFNKSIQGWKLLGDLHSIPFTQLPSQSQSQLSQPTSSPITTNADTTQKEFSLHISDIPPEVIGEQLCLHESNLFNSIDISELHMHFRGSAAHQKATQSPNVATATAFSRSLSQWVSSELASAQMSARPDSSERYMDVFCRIIELAHFCMVNNCYAAAADIYNTMKDMEIFGMNEECKSVPHKYKELLNSISSALSPDEDYKEYNTRIKILSKDIAKNAQRIVTGVVPHLSYYLKRIESIDRSENDFVAGGLINFRKHRKLGEMFLEIKRFQETRYTDFKPREEILTCFKNMGV